MNRLARIAAAAALGVALVPAGAADRASVRGEAALTKALGDRVAGKPVSCIPLTQIRSSRIFDGTAILYETTGNRYYLNRPTSGAAFLDDDDILVQRTYISQLCRLDTVRLIDRASRFPHGVVGLGDFVPYTKAKQTS